MKMLETIEILPDTDSNILLFLLTHFGQNALIANLLCFGQKHLLNAQNVNVNFTIYPSPASEQVAEGI